MQNALLEGEEKETDIVGPQVQTEMASPNRLVELASRWEQDAQVLLRHGDGPQAETCRRHAREVLDAMKAEQEVVFNLTVAAQFCGYSRDHLGRLVKEGKLTSYGQKGSPRVRLCDLPKKARAVVTGNSTKYDAVTDARSILGRGRRVA